MGPPHPSLDYVLTCSEPAAESFELARLNRASNLRKEMRELIDEWIDCEVEARLARWKRESCRAEIAIVETPYERIGGALPQQLALPLLFSSAPAEKPRSAETSALLGPTRCAPEASARPISTAKTPPRERQDTSLALAPEISCLQPIARCTAMRAHGAESPLAEVRRARNNLVSFLRRRPQSSLAHNEVAALLPSPLRSRACHDAQVPCTQASVRPDRAPRTTALAPASSRHRAPAHSRIPPRADHTARCFAMPGACAAGDYSGD